MSDYVTEIQDSTGHYFMALDGSRHGTREEASISSRTTAEYRTRLAGRPLTHAELRRGVTHVEDRTPSRRASDEAFSPSAPPVESDSNYVRRMRDAGEIDQRPGKFSRRELWKQAERQEDERLATEQAAEDRANDPKRQAAIAKARQLANHIRWDSTVPASLAARADQALREAVDGHSIEAFAELYSEARDGLTQHLAAQQQSARQRADLLREAADALEADLASFSDLPPAKPVEAVDHGVLGEKHRMELLAIRQREAELLAGGNDAQA